MPNPLLNPALLLSPVETGYVAYDPAGDQLHQLNPIAALLAELSDGTRSIDDIRQMTAPLMPDGKTEEVARWFDDALKAGVLVWQGSESARPRELTAKELYALTQRLTEYGKVQPAYICAKRVVELEPENWDALYDLGDLCQSVGRREEARLAFEKYFAVHPDDAEIEHLLIALADSAPPPRASDRTIQHIYKGFACTYEERMLKDLEYKGPERICDALRAVMGEPSGLAVLDLGCGSGLSGMSLKSFAARMVGVDLSPEMIELARARNIYDRLEIAEIVSWVNATTEVFDLVVSLDCLIYFGDLHEIVAAVAKKLPPGGIFAFSMELGANPPFQLTDTGRYAHHPDHVRAAAKAAGLNVERLDQAFLRMEYGSEVTGLFAVVRKPAS